MKVKDSIQFDFFEDGEAVAFSIEDEKTYIFNKEACYILDLIINNPELSEDDLKVEFCNHAQISWELAETDSPEDDFVQLLPVLRDICERE